MKLNVYKGFDLKFLSNIKESPLINSDISQKIDYLKIDVNKLALEIINKANDNDEYWMTYEEYQAGLSAINYIVDKKIIILKNNIYPDIYPIYSDISEELYEEYLANVDEGTKVTNVSTNFKKFKQFYNSLERIDNSFYITYYNDEYNNYKVDNIIDYYQNSLDVCTLEENQRIDFEVAISDDISNYIECINIIEENNYKNIGIKEIVSNETSNRIKNSLLSYAKLNNININKKSNDLNH